NSSTRSASAFGMLDMKVLNSAVRVATSDSATAPKYSWKIAFLASNPVADAIREVISASRASSDGEAPPVVEDGCVLDASGADAGPPGRASCGAIGAVDAHLHIDSHV